MRIITVWLVYYSDCWCSYAETAKPGNVSDGYSKKKQGAYIVKGRELAEAEHSFVDCKREVRTAKGEFLSLEVFFGEEQIIYILL